jgi:beta-galactosidase
MHCRSGTKWSGLVSFVGTAIVAVTIFGSSICLADVKDGFIDLPGSELRAGKIYDLDGKWLYKPGYAIGEKEQPEKTPEPEGYVSVPVPQMLSRIRWWLDDSEDFKHDEDARLQRLGFDTEKAEDGWCRLALNLGELPKGLRYFLQFEGVAMKCKVFCNGSHLGDHTGMFSRFEFDLTPHLKIGTNVVAVYVSMEKIPKSDLTAGEAVTVNLTASKVRSLSKGMFGPLSPGFDNRAYDLHGIWQPVRLAVRGTASIDDVWFAPSLDGAEVRVEASAALKHQTTFLKAKWVEVSKEEKSKGVDANHAAFAEVGPEKLVLNGRDQATLWLSGVSPKLWTPANPNLYELEVTLSDSDGNLIDRWSRNVGFRTFEIRGNQFYLNGKPYWLRGADHLPYGKNPFDPALPRKLVQLLHDANVRVTRTHATPWNEAWLDAADEIGLGVSIEGIRPWALAGKIGATPPELFKHWLMENEDVVKRCRNHPSVFIYTVGNEMMLRDTKSKEKWEQLSAVVKATRKADPTRPVIASSEYQRDAQTYSSLIQPNGFDDGDIDDIHRYANWYGPSSFVKDSKFESDLKSDTWKRPFIGQEMSSGYPDLDTGLPVLRYTRDLLTPQAWIGQHAYPGSDPNIFQEHHRAVTKRWAETLRYERRNKTAGFMMFAAECWFSHSYDPERVRSYPVYEAIREAWAPVGIALESGRRRFYASQQIETAVFVTNDDEQFRAHENLTIEVTFLNTNSTPVFTEPTGVLPRVIYYETQRIPIHVKIPRVGDGRERLKLIVRVVENGTELTRTTEYIEVFPAPKTTAKLTCACTTVNLGPSMESVVKDVFSPDTNAPHSVIILDLQKNSNVLTSKLHDIEEGATAIVLSPGTEANLTEGILDVKGGEAEFADWVPVAGTPLASGLEVMDLKWWAREGDWRTFIGSQSHRLKPNGPAKELLRYIPPHSYISADKIPEQYRTVLFEVPRGKGRIWICDLDLEKCAEVDPAARLFAENLLRAAVDADSTSHLPRISTHEELLKRH